MLTVVTWLWRGNRREYTTATVKHVRDMVAEHYAKPHRFLCVTDLHIDGVETVPPWNDFTNVQNPNGRQFPSCYRRLRAFHPDVADVFGDRFVTMDLDVLVVDDLVPVWDRSEDFVMWRDPMRPAQLNGSMTLMDAGARTRVWGDFDPATSPQTARRAGFSGSDQGWISYCLRAEATWTRADGVHSYRADCQRVLPDGARIVFFHGDPKPSAPSAMRTPWVAAHMLSEAA